MGRKKREKEKEKKKAERSRIKAAKRKKITSSRKIVDKWKRKRWITIISPAEFHKVELGTTIVEKDSNLIGRVIRANLGDLISQRQKRHVTMMFRVTGVAGDKASTEMVGHKISPSYMGRLTRRRSSKMEVVQDVRTKDKKKVKVKSVVISLKKIKQRQKTAIRKIMKEAIEQDAKALDYKKLMQNLIFGETPSKIFKDAKKIVSVKRVEVVGSKIYKEE